MPQEIERSAAEMGLSVEEFFRDYLVIDFWYPDNKAPIWMLSPGVVGRPTGREASYDPRGTCRLLKDGLCSVHATKPRECAISRHDQQHEAIQEERLAIAREWDKPHWQNLILRLLGREPRLPQPNTMEILALQFSSLGL